MKDLHKALIHASYGQLISWRPLWGVTEIALRAPWVYYRPLGFGLVELGVHDRIAEVLCNEEGLRCMDRGEAATMLMINAPYAFNSGVTAMGGDRPPFYKKGGPLTQSEILALSQAKPLEDFERWAKENSP